MRPASTTRNRITALAAGAGGGLVLTTHHPLLALLAAGILAAIFLGVVLPAIWSTRPTRRAAAQAVLTKLLNLCHCPEHKDC